MNTIIQTLGPSEDQSDSDDDGTNECIRWY